MEKQIMVHSIDHASCAHQLISVVPKPTYSYSGVYKEGISNLVEPDHSLPQHWMYCITSMRKGGSGHCGKVLMAQVGMWI